MFSRSSGEEKSVTEVWPEICIFYVQYEVTLFLMR